MEFKKGDYIAHIDAFDENDEVYTKDIKQIIFINSVSARIKSERYSFSSIISRHKFKYYRPVQYFTESPLYKVING